MRLNQTLLFALGLSAPVIAPAQDEVSAAQVQPIGFGIVTGRVVDSVSGNGIANVTVTVAEPNLFTVTDTRGDYRISDVPAGQHRITFYKGGYQYAAVPDAVVQADRANTVNFALTPRPDEDLGDIVLLDAIEVTADATQDGQIGLMNLREKAINVSDAIGAEHFSRMGLGDAADALAKVPGASVVDSKYVLIRGLGDRYANTLINGATVPSADPDKRAVQMDQFPTDLLESIQTSKSFTPDQPGSFSGGSVNIRTKSFPSAFFATVSASVGWNSQATGEDILVTEEGVDALAMGADDRGVPDYPEFSFGEFGTVGSGPTAKPGTFRNWINANPNDVFRTLLGDQRHGRLNPLSAAGSGNREVFEVFDAYAKSFSTSFIPHREKASPNYGLSAALGDSIDLGEERLLGYTLAVTYDRSNAAYEDGYTGRIQGDGLIVRRFVPTESVYPFADVLEGADFPWGETEFGVSRGEESVYLGVQGKIAYRPSANHELSLDVTRTQTAESEVLHGVGDTPGRSESGLIYENWTSTYTERSITALILGGKSLFEGLHEATLDWRLSWSNSTQDQPDLRVAETIFNPTPAIFNYDSGNVFDPSRFYRYLDESNVEGAIDVTVPFRFFGDLTSNIKSGVVVSASERTYDDDRISLQYGPRSGVILPTDLINSYERLQNVYVPGNIGVTSLIENPNGTLSYELGWWPYVNESYTNNYEGAQDVYAGYLMADLLVTEKWRVITGVRYESTTIDVDSYNGDGSLIYSSPDNTLFTPGTPEYDAEDERLRLEAEGDEVDKGFVLPALSVIYTIRDGMNLRFAYGRTFARPTFKEMTRSRIYDPFNDEFYQGNPALEMTEIDNFDLRWEWFMPRGQVLAVSAFYKDLSNPIEVLFASEGFQVIYPQNVDEGKVYGLEVEWRYDLDNLWDALEGFSLGGNFSVIESEVSIPESEQLLDPDSDTRPLLGQSNFIFNTDISYENFDAGTGVSVVFGYVGERLSLVTLGPIGDVYEQPAPSLDVILSQRLPRGWRVKLTARNLLDPDYEKIVELEDGGDFIWERFTRGRSYSLSASYSF